MRQIPVKLGPLALLLTVISICLTTLAILTFTTAEADRRLADHFAETIETRYRLESQGQAFLKEIDEAAASKDPAALAAYQTGEYNVYEKTIEDGDASLTVRVRNEDGRSHILSWKLEHSWEADMDVNVWNGLGW